MHDPTRIPRLTQALQRAWEGQPDLTFAQLIGVLENSGLGWGTTDEEAVELLTALEREHPSLIDAASGPHTITTVNPPHLVTITNGYVVVRNGADPERMPAVWHMGGMRKAGPGLPLVIADAEGVEHRLGIVSLLTRLEGAPEVSISGVREELYAPMAMTAACHDTGRSMATSSPASNSSSSMLATLLAQLSSVCAEKSMRTPRESS